MKVSSKELEAKKVKVVVDKNPVATSFEKWAQPGHFSRTLAKGPKTTTWIWNLHADAHDFDSQTNSLEDISRKIFQRRANAEYHYSPRNVTISS
jgi:photosystem I P700 chlorophyll a apoprotein A1